MNIAVAFHSGYGHNKKLASISALFLRKPVPGTVGKPHQR